MRAHADCGISSADGSAKMPRARAHLLCQMARTLFGKGGDASPRSSTEAQGPSNQVEADFIVGQHRGASAARAGFQGHQLLQVSVMSAQTRAMPQPGLLYRRCNDTLSRCGRASPRNLRFNHVTHIGLWRRGQVPNRLTGGPAAGSEVHACLSLSRRAPQRQA